VSRQSIGDKAEKPVLRILATRPTTRAGIWSIISAMNTPNARSRFLLLPQVDEASTMVKAPVVLRRYSLARLAASSPARPEQRPYRPRTQQ
jgi:hypothetical protein